MGDSRLRVPFCLNLTKGLNNLGTIETSCEFAVTKRAILGVEAFKKPLVAQDTMKDLSCIFREFRRKLRIGVTYILLAVKR